jgi:hypothetical protein
MEGKMPCVECMVTFTGRSIDLDGNREMGNGKEDWEHSTDLTVEKHPHRKTGNKEHSRRQLQQNLGNTRGLFYRDVWVAPSSALQSHGRHS